MRALALAAALLLSIVASVTAQTAAAPAAPAATQELQNDVATQIGNLYIVGATLRAQNHQLQSDLEKAEHATEKLDGVTRSKIGELQREIAKLKSRSCSKP